MSGKQLSAMISASNVFSVFVILLVGYVAVGLVLFFSQNRLLFYPLTEISVTPENIGLSYSKVQFRSSDDFKLTGWFVPGEKEREVVLFCHGNAGNISHRLSTIRIFHQMGLNVFIFDYRGYGESEGTPSEQGTVLDAQAAWKYLTVEKGVPAKKIIVFGRSLGGAVGARLCTDYQPSACILESTFTSFPALAATYYPVYPTDLLCRIRYDTLSLINSINCPILIIHSRDDELIPFKHGQKLYDALDGQGEFLEISGDHNSGFLLSGDMYVDGLRTFIGGDGSGALGQDNKE